MSESGLVGVAHVIQLAVAPVFLLTGIAGLLAVLTSRLARIVDRGRAMEIAYAAASPAAARDIEAEIPILRRRARTTAAAITLVVVAALLVCAVIAALFFGAFLDLDFSAAVGWVFIAAMASLIAGLLLFLVEVELSTHAIRFRLPSLPDSRQDRPQGGGPSE